VVECSRKLSAPDGPAQACGVYGASAITAVTEQNTHGVAGFHTVRRLWPHLPLPALSARSNPCLSSCLRAWAMLPSAPSSSLQRRFTRCRGRMCWGAGAPEHAGGADRRGARGHRRGRCQDRHAAQRRGAHCPAATSPTCRLAGPMHAKQT
jgi:hypothetical protein